jgi:hypothetical protein
MIVLTLDVHFIILTLLLYNFILKVTIWALKNFFDNMRLKGVKFCKSINIIEKIISKFIFVKKY